MKCTLTELMLQSLNAVAKRSIDLLRKFVDVLIVWMALYYVFKSLRKNVKIESNGVLDVISE